MEEMPWEYEHPIMEKIVSARSDEGRKKAVLGQSEPRQHSIHKVNA